MLVQKQTIEERYLESTPKSHATFEEALGYLPAGSTRTTVTYAPYPVYMDHAEGCYLWDLDGKKYIDFLSNYTTLILGHRHPKVMEAIAKQEQKGLVFGAPSELEVQLAKILAGRIPSVDKIRFANSGTEATMFAIRAARAYTGRDKIAKFEGGYHGTHDVVEASVAPNLNLAGPADAPATLPNCAGIPKATLDTVLMLPYNNREACERLLTQNAGDLAAVIVEPMLGAGGAIPAEPEFLRFLREITDRLGMLLIFDEVISFRLARGGAQERYGVTPDLTSLGKIIGGGGYPVGAFGGKAHIMSVFETKDGVCKVPHAGTFNGSAVVMAAGIATMEELTPEVYKKLDEDGEYVRTRISELFDSLGTDAQVTGMGSIFKLHFHRRKINDYRSAMTGVDRELMHRMHLSLLSHGIYMADRLMGCTSVPMTRKDLDSLVESLEKCVKENSSGS